LILSHFRFVVENLQDNEESTSTFEKHLFVNSCFQIWKWA